MLSCVWNVWSGGIFDRHTVLQTILIFHRMMRFVSVSDVHCVCAHVRPLLLNTMIEVALDVVICALHSVSVDIMLIHRFSWSYKMYDCIEHETQFVVSFKTHHEHRWRNVIGNAYNVSNQRWWIQWLRQQRDIDKKYLQPTKQYRQCIYQRYRNIHHHIKCIALCSTVLIND